MLLTIMRRAALFSWRLLAHERTRLLTSTAGIAFALLMMLLQIGFRNALLDSALQLLYQLDAQVLVINQEKRPFLSRDSMPMERLYQSLAAPGVRVAKPLWMDLLHWKNLEDGALRPIRVIGIRPGAGGLLIDEVRVAAALLRRPGTALLDARSRREYGHIGRGRAQVGLHEIEVVGTFPLGSDFEVDGNLIVSDETYFRLTGETPQRLEAALLDLEPGADVQSVVNELRAILPGDVSVFSKRALVERDLAYWRAGTPISVILLVGVGLAFAVGVVICYQILYTDVLDHLAEFATLKAIGYRDPYIRFVVLTEAWVLSLTGFGPAIVAGWALLSGLSQLTGLPASLGTGDALSVALLSLGMCSLAGVLALRKVNLLDPAELF